MNFCVIDLGPNLHFTRGSCSLVWELRGGMAKNKKTAVKYNSIFIIIGSPTNTQYCDDVIKEVHVLSTGTTTTATVYTRRRLKLITRLLVMLAGRWTEIWPASATKQKWISSKLSRTSLRFYIICVNIIMTHRSVARLGIYFREGFSLLFPSFPSFPSLCYPFLSSHDIVITRNNYVVGHFLLPVHGL